jgi:hypothetical protein
MSDTAEALDKILQQFLINMINAEHLTQDMDSDQKNDLYTRLHLKISLGGLGIISSKSVLEAAYVGSMALSIHWINKLIPNFQTFINSEACPAINHLHKYLEQARNIAPKELSELSIDSMLLQQQYKIQHIISNAIHRKNAQNLEKNLPQGPAIAGNQMYYSQLQHWDQERTIQHLSNQDKITSAFLTANPCAPLCAMSNEAFRISIQHRLLLPIGGQKEYCKCGQRLGHFFSHCYKCPAMSIRNQIRNTIHKNLKHSIEDLLKHRIAVANLNMRILKDEPILSDYFERKENQNNATSIISPESAQDPKEKIRADMAIKNFSDNSTTIIDFTFVEPTSKYVGAYNKIGQAAELRAKEKIKEYSAWNLNNQDNKLKIFSVETYGVISKDSKNLFNSFIIDNETESVVKNLIYQQLSVALHCLRANMFLIIKKDFASALPPVTPTTNRGQNL